MKTSPLSHEHIEMLRAQPGKEDRGICPHQGLGLPVRQGARGPHTSTGLPGDTGSQLELEREWSL